MISEREIAWKSRSWPNGATDQTFAAGNKANNGKRQSG
jgi:hypothetical protein